MTKYIIITKKLSKLEKYILTEGLKKIEEIKDEILKMEVESKFIAIPFLVDGVIDSIIFNTETKKFEYIEYSKGIGKGIGSIFSKCTGYFDRTKTKRICLKSQLS